MAEVEAVYEEEFAEKAPLTLKPFRLVPLFEKDSVKLAPESMKIVCWAPSAEKVLGEGLPPLMVTVAEGAPLAIVTVIG
jgi:hypothetical protein